MSVEVKDSILQSVKKKLNIPADHTEFDIDILAHINTTFAKLHQMGVGPEEVFQISDENSTWDEFIEDNSERLMVDSYMWLSVRMLFDPPTGSVATQYQELIREYEWRLNVTDDWED